MPHFSKNYVQMIKLMNKCYEKNKLSDVIYEEYSKLIGSNNKTNFKNIRQY